MKRNTRKRIYNRITQAQNYLKERNNKDKVDSFLEKYYQCELAATECIFDYRLDKKEEEKEIRIIVSTVKAALNHAGLNAKESLLNYLFAANDKRGQRSAKRLRNAIVHEISVTDMREVNNRFYELKEYMEEFLRSFDIE